MTAAFSQPLLAISFDEEFASLRGLRTGWWHTLLLVLVALTVVSLVYVVGIVLAIALLTLPAATAGRFTTRLGAMMALAVVLCMAATTTGLAASYRWDLPTGAVTILAATVLLRDRPDRRPRAAAPAAARVMAAREVIIIGGGASGIFAAIHAAEAGARVTVLEKSPKPLTKVEISGGGRCNVTHACEDPRELVLSYPRGGRELRGPFSRWHVRHTVDWCAAHGIVLKTEDDGRMFPVTDSSRTVIDAMLAAATCAGATVRTKCGAATARRDGDRFVVTLESGEELACDRLLVATGGMRGGLGAQPRRGLRPHGAGARALALHLPHHRPPAGRPRRRERPRRPRPGGRHEGADPAWPAAGHPLGPQRPGGPQALRLGRARVVVPRLHLRVAGGLDADDLSQEAPAEAIATARKDHPRKHVVTGPLLDLPKRLWERLVAAAAIPDTRIWTELTKVETRALIAQVRESRFAVTGKSLNKDEFVTCGGIPLNVILNIPIFSPSAPLPSTYVFTATYHHYNFFCLPRFLRHTLSHPFDFLRHF